MALRDVKSLADAMERDLKAQDRTSDPAARSRARKGASRPDPAGTRRRAVMT